MSERIAISLSADQWNTLLALLGEAPTKVGMPLVLAIQQQAAATRQALKEDDALVGGLAAARMPGGSLGVGQMNGSADHE